MPEPLNSRAALIAAARRLGGVVEFDPEPEEEEKGITADDIRAVVAEALRHIDANTAAAIKAVAERPAPAVTVNQPPRPVHGWKVDVKYDKDGRTESLIMFPIKAPNALR